MPDLLRIFEIMSSLHIQDKDLEGFTRYSVYHIVIGMNGDVFKKLNYHRAHQRRAFLFFSLFFLSYFLPITGKAQEQDPQSSIRTLLEKAESFLASQVDLPEGKPVLSVPDNRILIPKCIPDYDFSFPFSSKTSLQVFCKSTQWTLFLQISYEEVSTYVTFITDLAAGSLLTGKDLANGDSVEAQWKGRFLKTAVRSGQRFQEALLDDAVLVFKLTQDVSKGELIKASMYEQQLLPASLHHNKVNDSNVVLNAKAARTMAAGHLLGLNDLLPLYRVLEVKSPVSRGTFVNTEMVHQTDFWGRVPADALTDLDQLPHAVATSPLIPGQAIRLSQLRTVPAIQKGQVVKVSVERGQISISTQMTAENSAEIGQRIRLRNEESRQIVEGVVTAVGAATLP